MKWFHTVVPLLWASGVTDTAEADASTFPIWGEEARARGYAIPLPFGINLSYMNMRQNIDVDSISSSGLAFDSHPIPVDIFNIDVDHAREQSRTGNLRLDIWVFPFLNIYGLVGHIRGSSVSNVSVDADPSRCTNVDRIIASSMHRLYQSDKLQDINFVLDLKGTTWGTGITLAGGYENWSTLVDTNYTRTDSDVLDGKILALAVSLRVRYRFRFQGPVGGSHLNVWVGSMCQNVQREFRGSLSDLHMPAEFQSLIQAVNRNSNGRFGVKQGLTSPWSMLLGTQFEATPQFNALTEFGFNERSSFFIAGKYCF